MPARPACRVEFPRRAQSARGLAHSKTLRVRRAFRSVRQRLGVRRSSAAFSRHRTGPAISPRDSRPIICESPRRPVKQTTTPREPSRGVFCFRLWFHICRTTNVKLKSILLTLRLVRLKYRTIHQNNHNSRIAMRRIVTVNDIEKPAGTTALAVLWKRMLANFHSGQTRLAKPLLQTPIVCSLPGLIRRHRNFVGTRFPFGRR